MLEKIISELLIAGVVIFSFDFGRRWELSKTTKCCPLIGKE